ncbi:MAG: hypothetical protein H7258_15770 [Ferruginibacter sp.]|nr:hypothetical protein [Ferruginibacter sp.]
MQELKGCIAPIGKHTGERRWFRSGVACDKIKTLDYKFLEKKPFYLIIKPNHYDNKGKMQAPTLPFFKKLRNVGLVAAAITRWQKNPVKSQRLNLPL